MPHPDSQFAAKIVDHPSQLPPIAHGMDVMGVVKLYDDKGLLDAAPYFGGNAPVCFPAVKKLVTLRLAVLVLSSGFQLRLFPRRSSEMYGVDIAPGNGVTLQGLGYAWFRI